jgi:hypothetical protein
VGALRRIDPGLLRQSLHCSEARGSSAAGELREMLAAATHPQEAQVILQELALAEKGAQHSTAIAHQSTGIAQHIIA